MILFLSSKIQEEDSIIDEMFGDYCALDLLRKYIPNSTTPQKTRMYSFPFN